MAKLMIVLMIIIHRTVFIQGYLFMYNTDRYSETDFEYDCIDYEVFNDDLLYRVDSIGVSQSIRYCLRPSYKIDDSVPVLETQKLQRSVKEFTFKELHYKLKMTVGDLLATPGYATIDIIERYKIYLQTLDETMSQEEIYQCQGTWFGSECQYNFNIHSALHMRLNSIEPVHLDYLIWQRPSDILVVEMTCYTHLICNRGPPPACLDWREICDGKIDCANNGGIDERFCEQLQILKCNASEYRCRNGRQCIPKEFYRDDPLNPDCQDSSDEIIKDVSTSMTYPNECDRDPAFRCEERACPPNRLVCGDGQCVEYFHQCHNHRGQLLMLEYAIYTNQKSFNSCQHLPTSCGFQITNVKDCESSCWGKKILLCEPRLGQLCLSTVFKHSPARFRPNDDMYIFYDNNKVPPTKPWVIVPHNICYNETFCENMKIYPDNPFLYWCQHHQLRMDLTYVGSYSRSNFTATIQRLTTNCYRESNDNDSKRGSSSQKGGRSSSDEEQLKAFSEHYIYDTDRYQENYLPSRRNRIGSWYDEILWESMRVSEAYENAYRSSRPYNWTDKFPISKLCNNHNDLNASIFDGISQTDETECDHWPCDNVYTRCNNDRNCPNGEDELICTKIHCPDEEFLCLSIYTNKTECLSRKRLMDSKVDCIGGVDEYMVCNRSSNLTIRPFLCSLNNQCIDIKFVCDGVPHCSTGEDEYFCQSFAMITVLSMLRCETYIASIDKHSMMLSCSNITFKTTSFLSMMNLIPYPLLKSDSLIKHSREKRIAKRAIPSDKNVTKILQEKSSFYCNRGLDAFMAISYETDLFQRKCFCPPSYYGNQCQYQSDRVSLTLRMRFASNHRSAFVFLIILADENRHQMNSFIIHKHHPSEDCDTKFNYYLLYSSYRRNQTMNYFLHIDLFKQVDLSHYASWKMPLVSLLPVIRMALLLRVPFERSLSTKGHFCHIKCEHGQCMKYVNAEEYFCQCKSGWYGLACHIRIDSGCSSASLDMGSTNNRPICICPSQQFGPRCLLNSPCQIGVCRNGATCISLADLKYGHEYDSFRCVCTNEFEGKHCEQRKRSISFQLVEIPTYSFMIIHIFSKFTNESHTQSIHFKKLRMNSNLEHLFLSSETDINLIFIQFDRTYYLAVVQENNKNSLDISTIVNSQRRCDHVSHLLNFTVAGYHPLRRLKHYPRLCFERHDLVCFHDERFMCLCTMNHFSNCFEFDYKKNATCQEDNPCEKEGRCFEDRPECPTIKQCICSECYYGSRCQFTTSGLGISLDALLGYDIQPISSFSKQPLSVKISTMITIIMFLFGLFSNMMSLITFREGQSRQVGCGQYLLASSIAALLTMIMFALKFSFLLLTQMSIITHPTFLYFNCLLMDNLTKVCLAINNWLGACVAIERTISVIQKIKFNRRKSKRMAIRIVLLIIVSVTLSNLPDSLYRVLLHDEVEERTWCIVRYPPSVEIFNSISIFLHFVAPFTINGISAVIIIVAKAHTHFVVKKDESYFQHLGKELQKLKHILISPSVLVLLSIPRLMLAFIPGCMKSTEDLWIYLVGFFISFMPPILTFPIFVLPSRLYRKEFSNQAKSIFQRITSWRR